jgi:hypothetical protein
MCEYLKLKIEIWNLKSLFEASRIWEFEIWNAWIWMCEYWKLKTENWKLKSLCEIYGKNLKI